MDGGWWFLDGQITYSNTINWNERQGDARPMPVIHWDTESCPKDMTSWYHVHVMSHVMFVMSCRLVNLWFMPSKKDHRSQAQTVGVRTNAKARKSFVDHFQRTPNSECLSVCVLSCSVGVCQLAITHVSWVMSHKPASSQPNLLVDRAPPVPCLFACFHPLFERRACHAFADFCSLGCPAASFDFESRWVWHESWVTWVTWAKSVSVSQSQSLVLESEWIVNYTHSNHQSLWLYTVYCILHNKVCYTAL